MVAQAITFFVAGFETTSNALAFTLYELSLAQDCQDRLRDEIHEVIKSDEDITFENMQQMKYLDMVVAGIINKWKHYGIFAKILYCRNVKTISIWAVFESFV